MDRRITKTATLTLLIAGFTMISTPSEASRWANHGSKCSNTSRVSATMYNLPEEGKVRNFWSAVKLQGSGRKRNGRILDYRGKTHPAPKNCKTTTISASGQCLLSYLSVAADRRYFKRGDIIEVPSLRGLKVRLPNSGETIRHPGYFIVQNVGAAIKGPNRFDFFIGTDSPYTTRHSFGKMGLGNKFNCSKGFRRVSRRSEEYSRAYASIYGLTDSTVTKYTRTPLLARAAANGPLLDVFPSPHTGGRRATR